MLDWFERGVPLSLVLGAVDDVFDRRRARGEPLADVTLGYCHHAVERAARERRVFPGQPAEPGEPGPHKPGQVLAASPGDRMAWKSRAAPVLAAAAARIEAIAAAMPAPARAELAALGADVAAEAARLAGGRASRRESTASRLQGLDEKLVQMIERATPEAELAALERSVEERLAPHREHMSAAIFTETRRRAQATRLREHHGLPRLDLIVSLD